MVFGIQPLGLVIVSLLIGGGLLSAAIAVMAWKRRDVPGGQPFASFAFFAALWNLLVALRFLSPSVELSIILFNVGGIAGLITGIFFLVFAIDYSGYGDLLTPPVLALIWAEPMAYAVLTLTKGWHGILPSNPETGTYLGLRMLIPQRHWLVLTQSTISYIAALLGIALIAWLAYRARGGFRRQAMTLLVGSLTVTGASVLYWGAGFSLHPGMDPTPLAMVAMSVVFAFALFRQDFLSVAELAPEQLFEKFPDPVIVIDDDSRVIKTNQAGSAYVEVGDRLPEDLVALSRALRAGEQTVTLTTSMNEQRTYDITITPLFDPYDRQQGRLLVLRDVTVRKQRERELEAQNERLDRFARIVSHDLRNPLNVAAGHTELAMEDEDIDQLEEVVNALEDMESLIDDVLELAREEMVVEPEWTAIESLAKHAWPFVDESPTLEIETEGELLADTDRTAVLLGNLFRNAYEHGADDVRVLTGITEDGFYVADNGPGIPESQREEVFEEGFTTDESGTGIGLAIIAETAAAHGWDIGVSESRAGGARFDVTGAETRTISE